MIIYLIYLTKRGQAGKVEDKGPIEPLRGGGCAWMHVDLATLECEVAWPLGHHPRKRGRASKANKREREPHRVTPPRGAPPL